MAPLRPQTTAALASHLGLSRWTVSRVLNGHPGVKAETVERVKNAMRELEFQPSALARGLRGAQTATVGVCFQDLDSPVVAMRAASLQQLLRNEGYDTVIELSGASAELERRAIRRFIAHRVDGIVLLFSQLTPDDPAIELLQQNGMPCFWIDPEHDIPGDKAVLDRASSMRLLLQHFTSFGHRAVTLLGIDPDDRFGKLRLPGLRMHAPAFGLEFPRDFKAVFHPGEARQTFDYGYELAGELLSTTPRADLPTAVLALNDRIAIGAINRFREEGIQVPGEISITGYDNIPVAAHFHPPLTTVDHQTDRLMDLAVRGLLRRLDPAQAATPYQTFTVQPKLVVRQSTGPARKRD